MQTRRTFPYPQTLEEASRGFDFARVHRAYGSNDPDTLFGPAPTAVAPWPKAGRLKKGTQFDHDAIARVLQAPPSLTEFDPRHLHATQGSITRPGVDYYMNQPDYEQMGRTYADQGNVGNRFPVVYEDVQGRYNILSGHHRATAALLRGTPFMARHVLGPER